MNGERPVAMNPLRMFDGESACRRASTYRERQEVLFIDVVDPCEHLLLNLPPIYRFQGRKAPDIQWL